MRRSRDVAALETQDPNDKAHTFRRLAAWCAFLSVWPEGHSIAVGKAIDFEEDARPCSKPSGRCFPHRGRSPFLVGQVADETRVALTAAELADLRVRHPILAQVLADIDRLEAFAGSQVAVSPAPAGDTATQPPPISTPPLTLAEAQALLAPAKIDLTQLTPAWFAQLRQTVFQNLQEVTT